MDGIERTMLGDAVLVEDAIHLGLGDCTLRLRSNSAVLLHRLRDYFAHVGVADIEVVAVERDPPEPDVDFVDWRREPGKTGRKDAYADLADARLVRKVRTGMVFLQSDGARIAAGPCLRHDNQVINFINAQYMTWLQHRGWLICHAAGLVKNGRCLAIAGFSGGGKSTLMLRLMNDTAVSYLTNDRLFVRRAERGIEAAGIAKLPRVNPGTIVHDPALRGLMPAAQREEYLGLPPADLWRIEDKHDVVIDRVYGAGRIVDRAPLCAFLVLNWTRDGDRPLTLNRIDLAKRQDLLAAITKSPGPFYQFPDGRFFADTMDLDAAAYMAALRGVAVFEARGKIDFADLADRCLEQVMEDQA